MGNNESTWSGLRLVADGQMDLYARPYCDQTYFASNYQPVPAISVTNYAIDQASYTSKPSSAQTPSQQFETGHGSILTPVIDEYIGPGL